MLFFDRAGIEQCISYVQTTFTSYLKAQCKVSVALGWTSSAQFKELTLYHDYVLGYSPFGFCIFKKQTNRRTMGWSSELVLVVRLGNLSHITRYKKKAQPYLMNQIFKFLAYFKQDILSLWVLSLFRPTELQILWLNWY